MQLVGHEFGQQKYIARHAVVLLQAHQAIQYNIYALYVPARKLTHISLPPNINAIQQY